MQRTYIQRGINRIQRCGWKQVYSAIHTLPIYHYASVLSSSHTLSLPRLSSHSTSHYFSSIADKNNNSNKQIVSNITPGIEQHIGANLHLQPNHPLCIIKQRIVDFFNTQYTTTSSTPLFKVYDNKHPKVSVQANFDDLLIPVNHVSRRVTDTFYYDNTTVLRTHTSAHQTEFLRAGNTHFLVVGDCYRRDEIDASHYPVFHQMEGVKLFDMNTHSVEQVVVDLKQTLEGMVCTFNNVSVVSICIRGRLMFNYVLCISSGSYFIW